MCASNLRDICHIENIDHGSHDVTEFGPGLAKRRRDRGDRGYHLLVGIAIEMVSAGRRSGDKDLVADADGARITVYVLEWIARRETCSGQRPFPAQGGFSRARS